MDKGIRTDTQVGPVMHDIIMFVGTDPGRSKAAIVRNVLPNHTYRAGSAAIDRCITRGYARDTGRDSATRIELTFAGRLYWTEHMAAEA